MTQAIEAKNAADETNGVQCKLDDQWVHSIKVHLTLKHPEVSVDEYVERFPDAPLTSPHLEAAKAAKKDLTAGMTATVHNLKAAAPPPRPPIKKPFAEVFDLGNAPAAKNKRGDAIMISVIDKPDPEIASFVPPIDDKYVFDIDLLKAVMMGIEMNKPILLWGMHGTGKSSLAEQYCAHTNRPHLRVQHTISTEEAHILGQFILVGKETVFNPGPLAYAMRYGLVYVADEYDFALPAVTSVYQPVLEGKSLIIKEACPEWRVVHPHPNFRFIATGNTNGAGDETGLYQGTQLQNAANYSRFGITVEVKYMPEKLESAVIASQGEIHAEDATSLCKIANLVRDAFRRGDIAVTVSPRELITAAQLGRALGGEWKQALALAYTNRLNLTDRDAVMAMIQRILP